MAVQIIQAGSYDLLMDTGFDSGSFTLDDPVKGILDGPYPLGPGSDFVSIIDGSTSITVFRGRRDIGDQGIIAGTMTFNLLDPDNKFNPFYTSSPYYDPTTDQPGLAPMRRVILTRDGETLFSGQVVNYSYSFNLGELDVVTVSCADDFYLLSQSYLTEWDVTEELSSARFAALLDLPEVSYPALTRNISTGTQTLGGSVEFTVADGTSVAAYASLIQAAEQGRIFVARNGDLTFQSRIGVTTAGAVATFKDDGISGVPYNDLGISFGADEVVNRASVQILGSSNTQISDDSASIAQYFIQTKSISGSLLSTDDAALALSEYLLVPQPIARYTNIGTTFSSLTDDQRDIVAVIDLGDTVTIEKDIGGVEYSQELAIEGIEHRINVSTGHTVTLFTSPTTIVNNFILDDVVFGIMDDPSNVLAA